MEYQCALQGTGFTVGFTMTHISKHYLDVIVTFVIDPTIQSLEIRSVPNYITVDEVGEVLTYFDEHVTHIETDSYVFMPLECGFQLQAGVGDRGDNGTGYISLLVLLNIGFNKSSTRLYCGGDVIVQLAELDVFLQELRAAYLRMRQAQPTMIDPELTDG
jgi:hypothetical protein